MLIAAVLSVAVLLIAIGWQANKTIVTANPGAFTGSGKVSSAQNQTGSGTITEMNYIALADEAGPNDFSNTESDVFGQLFGTYISLKNSGTYTEEKGADLANRIAEATVAQVEYTPIARSEIKTDSDVSRERVLAYRNDLQTALAPFLTKSESELGIFNSYVQTGDKHNLELLADAAGKYRKTVSLLSAVTVPQDAIDYHLGITNSLLQFAVTLDAMIKNADDPMATLALLRTYNSAEDSVYTSFSSLASYEKRKI